MKKGAKLTDSIYTLEIRTLSRKHLFKDQHHSLRELVQRAARYVPDLAGYSKVYRFMREHVGVYAGLYVSPLTPETVAHVLVTITSDAVSEADFARWRARYRAQGHNPDPAG